MLAVPARAVDAADPGDTDACTDWKFGRRAVDHIADDLMTGDDVVEARRKFAFGDVQIGAADAAGTDLQKHVAGLQSRTRDVLDVQRFLCDISGSGKDVRLS